MNIILFGPPGAGKGTQANKIAKKFNLEKISTGDLLRNEVKKNTDIGKKVKPIIDKGSFVPDSLISDLLTHILSNQQFYNRLIFDGYPRNLKQAQDLDSLIKKHNQKISFVLNLNVDKELLKKRILGRQICTNCGAIFNEHFKTTSNEEHTCGNKFLVKRSDDDEKIILLRFETYLDKTLPILDYYKKLNLLHEINGNTEIDQIFKEICAIIGSLEA